MYQNIFAEAMKNKWEGSRVYVDLFAGPGCVRIRDTRTVHPGTPILAMLVNPPFDRYVFADKSDEKLAALRSRATKVAQKRGIPWDQVRIEQGNVNDLETVDNILAHVPEDTLTLCFADPYSCNLHFDTIARIAKNRRVDFLIILALGMDANLNWSLYLKADHPRLDNFLGNDDWRERWEMERERVSNEEGDELHPIHFLADEYARSMNRLGFLKPERPQMYLVRSDRKNLPLYYLAMFSEKPFAYSLWDDVLTYSEEQLTMGI